MKIYTKQGDQGQTSLADGKRVSKHDPIFEQIGALDELSADLGLTLTQVGLNQADRNLLLEAQGKLLCIGGLLAQPITVIQERLTSNITPAAVLLLEKQIDQYSAKLPPLNNFILPGGSELAARLHRARTGCRRAERLIAMATLPATVKSYLNRLSDYLFVLARWANHQAGEPDTTWQIS